MRERGLLWWWWFLLLLVFCLVVVVWGGGGGAARANDTKAMLIMCKREREKGEGERDSFADEDVQNKHHLCHVQDVQTILLLHVHIL